MRSKCFAFLFFIVFRLTTYYGHGHNLVLLKFTIKQLETKFIRVWHRVDASMRSRPSVSHTGNSFSNLVPRDSLPPFPYWERPGEGSFICLITKNLPESLNSFINSKTIVLAIWPCQTLCKTCKNSRFWYEFGNGPVFWIMRVFWSRFLRMAQI